MERSTLKIEDLPDCTISFYAENKFGKREWFTIEKKVGEYTLCLGGGACYITISNPKKTFEEAFELTSKYPFNRE